VVLNCPEPESAPNVDEEEWYCTTDVDRKPITETKVKNPVKKLKNGKAAGIDRPDSA